MCGIAGFCGAGDIADLAAMTAALAHRGPDGVGSFAGTCGSAPVYLGHRRLAVLDLAGGHQPMFDAAGELGVVFNGEIYNHRDLRAELEAKGHRFRTDHSDTEVLVHGYREWGRELPARLNGMFAFAILDLKRGELFLARDRFGEKPLYFTHQNGTFGFASELSALVQHRRFDAALDPRAVQKLFAYGFIPAPNSLYRGCRKLPAGSWLRFRPEGGDIEIGRYWHFRIEPDEAMAAAGEDALAEELRHLLLQAVERRLISDVPLGLFLSGGIDSSVVLACARRLRPDAAIKTFTIGFTDPTFDESAHGRAMAAAAHADHHEEILDLDRARDLIPEVLRRLDEPLGDGSILPTYLLSAFTRRKVTVALSGDGGDELFAGYDTFGALGAAQIYGGFVPRPIHRGLRRLAGTIPASGRNMSLDFKIRRALAGLGYPRRLWNPVWLAPLDPKDSAEVFETPIPADELYEEAIAVWDESPQRSLVDKTLDFYTNLYLQDDILTKVDRAAMMSSLESRAVFLDNDLVEFCRRLPHRFKLRRGERKYLLRKAVADMLPPSVMRRAKKGFGIPLMSWLKKFPPEPPLRPCDGIRIDAVARRWREHREGTADHRQFLWTWLSLQAVREARHVAGPVGDAA